MADEITRTMIDDHGFGGLGLGAGFLGGLIIGNMWNGNWGWGGGYNHGYAPGVMTQNALDTTQLANAIEHVSDQVTQGNISQLQSASSQNMFMGNLVNQTGDAITAAINGTARDTTNAINATNMNVTNAMNQANLNNLQATYSANMNNVQALNDVNVSSLRNTASLQQTLCGMSGDIQNGFCGVTNAVNMGVGLLNNNITTQGYENRLNTQQLAAQMQQQCCQLSREIYEQGCANRELQRQIQTEAITAALADAKAQNAALQAQINFNNSQSAQTAYLIDQLKPAATAA